MRVQCDKFEEFEANLEALRPDALFLGTVWVAVERNPLGNKTRREAVSFEVVVWAGCVVRSEPDGGEYLLEFGQTCGTDLLTADGSDEGSDVASEIKRRLADYCGKRGWTVRPGRLHED